MNWIDTEKEKLIQNIMDSGGYEFPVINRRIDTYFEEYSDCSGGVEEYTFNTLPELIRLMQAKKTVMNSDGLDRICATIAYKYRNEFSDKNVSENEVDDRCNDRQIPTYIYNF